MVGLVLLTKEEEFQEWLAKGPMELLCQFGIRED
jgi:hypothetical protein